MNRHLRILLQAGFIWFFMFVGIVSVYAQQKVVSGLVKDTETGESLIGVNVTAATNKSIGTVTDIDGKYTLTVPDTVRALSFSLVGYTTRVAQITSTVLNIELAPGKQLTEIVVVGYGTQKTREVTSAVSSVKSEDFNRGNISDPIQLVQGKVAGLSIAKPGSDPNADFIIRLRGLSTFGTNTQPLIVIDGIPGANLKSIDPQDIVSIDVLKDASASAIYGTRGASGVILITTKKGEYVPGGKAFNVEFGSALTAETVGRKIQVLSADDYLYLTKNDSNTNFGYKTDWIDELTNTAISQTYNLAINGADQNTNYRVAVNYRSNDGVIEKSGFNQLNGRLNLSQRALKNKLLFDINLSTTMRNETYVPYEAMQYAVRFNPTAPVHASDPFSEEWGGYFQRNAFYFYNPKAIIEQSTLDGKKFNLQGGFKGTYEIIKGLKASAFYTFIDNNDLYGTYWSKNAYWTPYDQGSHKGYARRENSNFFNHMLELTGSYEKTIKEFSFSALAGYSWQETVLQRFWAYGEDFLTDDFSYNNLGAAQGIIQNSEAMGSYKEKTTLIGFYGRLTGNYNERVFMTLNFRRDGSSMFGTNKKWGNFPGVSAGVDIAKFVAIPYVDRLKVRGSYGVTGNLPSGPYESQFLYNSTSTSFFYNGTYIQAFGPIAVPNPNLQWETKEEYNIGLDFAVLNYRINGSLDYYSSRSSELIANFPVPVPPNPAPNEWLNLGELSNSGIEFNIGYQTLPSRKLLWTTELNFAKFFDTKLVKITDTLNTTAAGTIYLGELGDPYLVGKKTIFVEQGKPIGQIIAPIYLYTDTNGVMQFKKNGGGTTPTPVNADYQVVGNGLPDFQIGWNNSFSYKGFYLSFFLRAVMGHSLVNVNNAKFGVPVVLDIQSGMDQILDFQNTNDGPVYSNVHVEKADFLKLDNWSFGYNFKIKDNDYIKSVNLYLSGQNLFTITSYSGVDPEVRYVDSNDNNNVLAPGIDRQRTYFATRTFTLGVNVVF